MKVRNNLSRRDMLQAAVMLPLAGVWSVVAATDVTRRASSNLAVAYFSRSGNTRVIAGQIRRALGADLFEIHTAVPYPDDYEETVEQARRERDSGYKPALQAQIPNMSAYQTLFLGFPIWEQTMPPVMRSFLSVHDLSGKILVPFITHGGYGIGNSLSVLAEHAPKSRLQDAHLVMQADQEKQTLERVTRWLANSNVTNPSNRP